MSEDNKIDQFLSQHIDRQEDATVATDFTKSVMSIIQYEQIMAGENDQSRHWQKIALLVTAFSFLALVNTAIAWYFGVFSYLYDYFGEYLVYVNPVWIKYLGITALAYLIISRIILSIPFLFKVRI
jgi:hypothetical protein